MNIAAVILTLNEENDIARCLSSLKWVDEIIVLDSGSTDKTLSVAKTFGCKVFEHKQDGVFDISKQRNYALEKCSISSEWVIFVDADEVITTDLRDEILAIVNGAVDCDAYSLTPKYMFYGKWLKNTQGFPNWHDRLLRNNQKVSFIGGVWESFDRSVEKGYIQEPYLHFANSKGVDEWLMKHIRYADWDSKIILSDKLLNATRYKTYRKKKLRGYAKRFWPLRPYVRFFYMYVIRGGFLEGWQGFVFCLYYFVYEMIVFFKVVEGKMIHRGVDL